MTYQDDPNLTRLPNRRVDQNETSYTPWIIGAVVAIAVILGIFAMTNRSDNTNTAASNPNKPAATTTAPAPATVPPATTGSAAPSAPAQAPAAR